MALGAGGMIVQWCHGTTGFGQHLGPKLSEGWGRVVGGWLMKGHVMSESGLANRDSRETLGVLGVADSASRGDEQWLGRGSEYDGCGQSDEDQARPDSSGLVVAFLRWRGS